MKLPPRLVRTSAAVAATAVIGVLGTDVTSRWYRNLDKPAWQPPGAAFGPAWTTLYGLMAVASARTLDRIEDPAERRAFTTAFGANLMLNAGWNWLFFTARRPRWALAEILLMEASTLDLTRRAAQVDRGAAKMLIPYAGWVAFATALNASIAARNPVTPVRLQRTVTVQKPLDKVFAYLSDFTTTTEWDPGTVKTVRTSGDGTFGTEYLNTSTFAGRQTQLTYVVVDLVPNRHISLRGENKTVIAHDTMTFRKVDGDTEVTYTADFTFKGITRFVAPLMKPAFTRLGNEAEAGMAAALERL